MLATLRQRDFGLLWFAGLVSIIGDFALLVALPLHVYRLTGSTVSTAGTFAAALLPGIIFGSIAGVFVDRWDRKRTMIVSDLARAVLLLPLVFAPDRLALIYALAAAQGAIGLFFSPAEQALLPKLVGEDKLVTANALTSLSDNVGFLAGPAIGAALYAWIGINGVAIIDSVSYVGSALFISLIAAESRPARDAAARAIGSTWTHMAAEWKAGLAFVRRDRSLSVLYGASVFNNLAEGIFITLSLSPLVLEVFRGRPEQVGWLSSAQGVGGIAAGLALARIGSRAPIRWLLGGGLAGLGFADLTAANALHFVGIGTPAVAFAMGCMVAAGFPAVAGLAGSTSLIQTRTTDAYRGRVFGALRMVQSVAMMIGLAIGGVLGDHVSIVPVLSAGALTRVAGGLFALTLLPRHHKPKPVGEYSGNT